MASEKLSSAGRKLLSGSMLRLANLFVAAVSAFFLMPFIVHHIGDRLYGFWTLASAFVGYYGLLDFGFSIAVSQYMSIAIGQKDERECRAVFNAALRIQTLLGGVAVLATVALAAAAPWLSRSPADAALFWKVIAILGMSMAIGFPPPCLRRPSGSGTPIRYSVWDWNFRNSSSHGSDCMGGLAWWRAPGNILDHIAFQCAGDRPPNLVREAPGSLGNV